MAPDPRPGSRQARHPANALLGGLILAIALATAAIASAGAPADPSKLLRTLLPAGFPQPRVPADRPVTSAKAELGRRLFYDVRLSGNGSQSCGTCHLQALAFTDGRRVAIGSTNAEHPRNTPSLVNVAYMQTLTWADPRVRTLEEQLRTPLFGTAPVEMGITPENQGRILARIQRDEVYARRFERAFPRAKASGRVSWDRIGEAIAAFERTIIAGGSTYDRWRAGRARLTAAEARGRRLFNGRAGCASCHSGILFTDQAGSVGSPQLEPAFHNVGLYDVDGAGGYPAPNRGLFEITGQPADMGRFRTPSLRNVARTAPYMHDGSVKTLEQAVAHAADGGRLITGGPLAGDGRANPFKDPRISGLQLGDRDRSDLVAFLRTLTDRSVLTDRRFANPFAR